MPPPSMGRKEEIMIDASPTKGRGKKENDIGLPYPGAQL